MTATFNIDSAFFMHALLEDVVSEEIGNDPKKALEDFIKMLNKDSSCKHNTYFRELLTN